MRRLAAAAAAVLAAVVLTGCANQAQRDVERVPFTDPDAVHVYGNVDKFPNIAIVCIDGTAFATTTRGGNSAAFLVPSLDATCPAR